MTSRFASNLVVLVSAAFLLVARFAFGTPALRWLATGIGALAVLVVAAAFLFRGRGPAQRGLDVVLVVIGGWTVVSSLTFSGPTLLWLVLLEGAAMAGLALIGLIVHEAVMESAIGQWQPLTGFEPVPSDGKPVSSDGERVSSDGEPVASDGEPVGMTAWRR